MSDEELDDARKLVSSDHSKGCDMRYAACKCGYEASLEAAVPYLIARLDAAEREREAFAERVFRHGFSDGWTANQKGRLAASASVDEAWHFYVADGALQKSVALTANHSPQDQEQ